MKLEKSSGKSQVKFPRWVFRDGIFTSIWQAKFPRWVLLDGISTATSQINTLTVEPLLVAFHSCSRLTWAPPSWWRCPAWGTRSGPGSAPPPGCPPWPCTPSPALPPSCRSDSCSHTRATAWIAAGTRLYPHLQNIKIHPALSKYRTKGLTSK